MPIEQIAQIIIAAIGGGTVSILIKSLFDQRKTSSEAEKNEAQGEAFTIGALRLLQVDLLTQVQTLGGQVQALQKTNSELMLQNAEMHVQLAIQQEQNRNLISEVEASRTERQLMQSEIQRLQEHVAQLEAKK